MPNNKFGLWRPQLTIPVTLLSDLRRDYALIGCLTLHHARISLSNPCLSDYDIVCSCIAIKGSGRSRRSESAPTRCQSHRHVHCLFTTVLLSDLESFCSSIREKALAFDGHPLFSSFYPAFHDFLTDFQRQQRPQFMQWFHKNKKGGFEVLAVA